MTVKPDDPKPICFRDRAKALRAMADQVTSLRETTFAVAREWDRLAEVAEKDIAEGTRPSDVEDGEADSARNLILCHDES